MLEPCEFCKEHCGNKWCYTNKLKFKEIDEQGSESEDSQ